MILSGIDYSMSSPAICIYNTDTELTFKNCTFFVYSSAKKYPVLPNVKVTPQRIFTSQQHRFDLLSEWALECLKDTIKVGLEGYSYGSKSNRLFDIGENGGVLKHKLWKNNIPFDLYAPGEIKKFYTGKGNANKDLMYTKFLEVEKISLGDKSDSPVSDIVDSYAIVSYLASKIDK